MYINMKLINLGQASSGCSFAYALITKLQMFNNKNI